MAESNSESSKSKDGPRKCKACDITLPDIYTFVEHLESKEHTKGIMKKKYGEKYLEAKANLFGKKIENEIESDSNKSESSDDEGDVYTCEVCEKICTGILSYKLHLSGKAHQKKVKKMKLLKQMKLDKVIKENGEPEVDNQIVDGLFGTNQYSSSDMLCKVCNKKCTGPEAYKQHINSETHKKKLAMQSIIKNINPNKNLSKNESDEDDDVFRCEVCSKEFSGPLPYQQHMESTAHLKQNKLSDQLTKFKDILVVSEDTNQFQCKECNKYFSGLKPFKDHLQSSLHSKIQQKKCLMDTLKKKHPEMIVSLPLSDDENEDISLLCSVCHVGFSGPESARDHLQSQKHKKVLKEKMRFEKHKQLLRSKKSNSKSKAKETEEEDKDSSDSFDVIE